MIKNLLFLTLLSLIIISCAPTNPSHDEHSLLIHNGSFYSPHDDLSQVEAILSKNGVITQLFTDKSWQRDTSNYHQLLDAQSNFVMPGFIESHGHFHGLGSSFQHLNFLSDTSWQQVVEKVSDKVTQTQSDNWVYGRGWHQEKWSIAPTNTIDGYPTHHTLSEISPNNPLLLVHASGHSLFANERAMKTVGINKETPDPIGGKIIRDGNGVPTGVFEENAMQVFNNAYQRHLAAQSQAVKDSIWLDAIELAQVECLRHGITSFQDAGTKNFEIAKYVSLAEDDKLDLRLWVMLRERIENLERDLSQYKVVGAGNGYFTCNAIKTELDGALGAHGAWLLEPYTDKPDFVGQNTTSIEDMTSIAKIAYDNEMQLCVHAIGDKANRETINVMETFKDSTKDLRWRIEHAQHLHPDDIQRMADLEIIASMQAIHCTSDAPFVVKRLGTQRAREGAYAWRSLLDRGAKVINGTDAPVELLNPLASFYSSVTRKHPVNQGDAFFAEQAMTREEAIRSYTLDAAYGAFEEQHKGSLEVGKYADLVILDKNLITCSDEEILDCNVVTTIVGGSVKYRMP